MALDWGHGSRHEEMNVSEYLGCQTILERCLVG